MSAPQLFTPQPCHVCARPLTGGICRRCRDTGAAAPVLPFGDTVEPAAVPAENWQPGRRCCACGTFVGPWRAVRDYDGPGTGTFYVCPDHP